MLFSNWSIIMINKIAIELSTRYLMINNKHW
jgi:hypothetical protein